jgi:hypothetical protein
MRLISISDSSELQFQTQILLQRFTTASEQTTANLSSGGGYLAFLGRIAPEKGPETAIQIARSAGIPLKIAAKVDRVTNNTFANESRRC